MFRYVPALLTAIVWGSTFIASKHIITHGIPPCVIMFIRFILAYLAMWCLYPKRVAIKWNRDELRFVLLGLAGGSLYFLFEYHALQHTSAMNVGLITSTVPIVGSALQYIFYKQMPRKHYFMGSVLAFVGVVFVVLSPVLQSGDYALLSVNIVGDLLCVVSVLLWSVYSLVLDKIPSQYDPFLVSRRLFFYALITILPVVVIEFDTTYIKEIVSDGSCMVSILYLGLVASAVCIWMWNWSFREIGLSKSNVFLYLMPLISLVTASIYDVEEFSLWAGLGAGLIFAGIIWADRK